MYPVHPRDVEPGTIVQWDVEPGTISVHPVEGEALCLCIWCSGMSSPAPYEDWAHCRHCESTVCPGRCASKHENICRKNPKVKAAAGDAEQCHWHSEDSGSDSAYGTVKDSNTKTADTPAQKRKKNSDTAYGYVSQDTAAERLRNQQEICRQM